MTSYFFDSKYLDFEGKEPTSSLLFHGNVSDWQDFLDAMNKCVETIIESDNIRLIVLETWLFLDYCVRQILYSSLNLKDVDHPEYSLKENLFTQSFSDCVELLFKMKKINKELNPSPFENQFILGKEFRSFLRKEHPEFLNELENVIEEFNNDFGLNELINSKHFILDASNYSRFSSEWFDLVKKINAKWIKRAKRIYSARNLAAHSHNEERIAERLGINGEEKMKGVRKECLFVLRDLVGIKIRKDVLEN